MRCCGERGVVLLQTALALVVLLGFCGMVIDMGFLTVARAQAQNAADAGALAAAAALAFDGLPTGVPPEADQSARAAAAQNKVMGAAASVAAPTFSAGSNCRVSGVPIPITGSAYSRFNLCVTVDVFRNGENGSSRLLPFFLGRLVDMTSGSPQGVKARAIGTPIPANTTTCVWPIAIADRWREVNPSAGGWVSSPLASRSEFTKYAVYPALAPLRDTYAAPSGNPSLDPALNPGLRVSARPLGQGVFPDLPLTLLPAPPATPAGLAVGIKAGEFVRVVVPRADGGGFDSNLTSCNGIVMHIGDTLALDTGSTDTQVRDAARARYDADLAAHYNTTTLRIDGGCSVATVGHCPLSPRLVVVPLFDVERYEDTRWMNNGRPVIRITNFAGLFIENPSMASVQIPGHLTTYPGRFDPTRPAVTLDNAFLRGGILYR
jgi:Flp pilus assembly protein TadG